MTSQMADNYGDTVFVPIAVNYRHQKPLMTSDNDNDFWPAIAFSHNNCARILYACKTRKHAIFRMGSK